MQTDKIKDTIDHLSFSHDGKKLFFDRCRDYNCQIQVYDLATGELNAYQPPPNEQWTMAKNSYDGKKIVFSTIPAGEKNFDLMQMQIAVMDTDGKNYRKLTSSPFPKLYPTFSQSGKKVLYVKASRIRKQGRTPASGYDAWEVDIETGKETRLTHFEYFHMGSVCYFPGDEKFLYYAEGPFAFPGLTLPKNDVNAALRMIGEEARKNNVYLVGVLTMKHGDVLPQRPYHLFEKGHPPIRPLLSKDGTRLFFIAAGLAGKYYLYSPDGNHRQISDGGSIDSAAVSPDGELLGVISVNMAIDVHRVHDGHRIDEIYVPIAPSRMANWDNDFRKFPRKYRLLPDLPAKIIH